MKTSLFHASVFQDMESSSFGLSQPDSTFPLLSQGDHPTLGTPAWYFHPCETTVSVGEVMAEFSSDNWTHDEWLVGWLEAWFMILGTVVDLRS
jgi:ubiquitin-like-conjugating enzyme ATG10